MISLARYCRFLLAYNLAVIVWGAYVRASGSGAGCGSHWPSCNGEVVPPRPSTATLIEYSHRVSSGLVLVLVAVLVVWAFMAVPKGHPLRRGAVLSLVFTLSEAAVGAGLVLFKLVAHDESLARALVISTHLLNTLLLLAALTLAAYAAGAFRVGAGAGSSAAGALSSAASDESSGAASDASSGAAARAASYGAAGALLPGVDGRIASGSTAAATSTGGPKRRPMPGWSLALGLAATMAIAATGAVSALGDTLFPASSLSGGLAQDLSSASHLLLRLRTIHPLLAIALGAYLLHLCKQVSAAGPEARRWANRLRLLVVVQWTLGLLNIALLAPVWLQLTHLLIADLLWIALVVMTLEALAPQTVLEKVPPLMPAPARS
ncbi:MAG TPA: COX15/CtaA family protein [Thermoanaerobaculia bacterium]|nr:COX15/CtaA family protein [Thermoanaerobaculia bacterium]